MTQTVHRIIERHAAINADAVAVIDGGSSCSYRELNAAANVLARRLMSGGFRREMRALIRMAPSVDLAVVLLAVLKTGGRYTWRSANADERPAFVVIEPTGEHRDIDLGEVRPPTRCSSPNLPVITRETDIACVLESTITVPHATIGALATCAARRRSPWVGESGAFDLWAALIAGVTAVIDDRPAVAA